MFYILSQIGFDVLREQGHNPGTPNCEEPTLTSALAASLWGCIKSQGTELILARSSASCCHVPWCWPSSISWHFLQKSLKCLALQYMLLSGCRHFTWLCKTAYGWQRIEGEAL